MPATTLIVIISSPETGPSRGSTRVNSLSLFVKTVKGLDETRDAVPPLIDRLNEFGISCPLELSGEPLTHFHPPDGSE